MSENVYEAINSVLEGVNNKIVSDDTNTIWPEYCNPIKKHFEEGKEQAIGSFLDEGKSIIFQTQKARKTL